MVIPEAERQRISVLLSSLRKQVEERRDRPGITLALSQELAERTSDEATRRLANTIGTLCKQVQDDATSTLMLIELAELLLARA